MANLEMRQTQEMEPTMRDRLVQVVERWEDTLSSFCLIFGFFLGLVFVANSFHDILGTSSYGDWNPLILLAIGISYIVLTGYAGLYPERNGAYGAIFVESVVGILSALRPFSIIGLGFWLLALATVAHSLVSRRREARGEGRPWLRR